MCIRDSLKAIGSYSGNVAYCIEPGISLKVGQTMNKYDENYFNNLASNGVVSGDEIRLFVGYKRKLLLESSLELEKKKSQNEQELNNERLRFYTNITHELRLSLIHI